MTSAVARLVDLVRREGTRGAVRRIRDRRRVARLRGMSLDVQYRTWERRLRNRSPIPSTPVSVGATPVRFRILVFGDEWEKRRITCDSLAGVQGIPWTVESWNDTVAGLAEDNEYWIAVGAGDRFAADALPRLSEVLRAGTPGVRPDLLYADEDHEREDGVRIPFLKPAWSPTLPLTLPGSYPGVPTAISARVASPLRETVSATGLPWVDLVLRAAERARRIVHLPVPLVTRSFAAPGDDPLLGSPEKRLAVVRDALDRRGIAASPSLAGESSGPRVVIRLGLEPSDPDRLVSILLPTRDQPHMLRRALETVRILPGRVRRELIVVDHRTTDPAAVDLIRQAGAEGARVLRVDGPFNYSALINRGAEAAKGDVLLLLNNDVESSSTGWLDPLLGAVALPGAAIGGTRLLYEDGRCQHGGIGLGIGTVAGHLGKGGPGTADDAFVGDDVAREVGAVTGACLLVKTDTFRALGGLDERQLAVSFSDVDLCLRARRTGGSVVYEPSCPLIHHETVSRDRRLDVQEMRVMHDRWGAELANDPYLSPHRSRLSEDAQIRLWPVAARVAGGRPADSLSPREWTREPADRIIATVPGRAGAGDRIP